MVQPALMNHIKDETDDPVVGAALRFDEFYAQEYRGVIGLAFSLSNSPSAAEELTQDAFVAAYKRWGTVSAMERPDAWIRRVVANMAASRVRRLVAEGKAMVRKPRTPAFMPEPSADSVALWTAVASLPRRQTEVVVLIYYAMMSHEEVAGFLGVSIETVRTHLQRAKKRLQKSLEWE